MDKTNEKHFGLRVDGDILAKFRYVCGFEGRSANAQIIQLMLKFIADYEKEHGKIQLSAKCSPEAHNVSLWAVSYHFLLRYAATRSTKYAAFSICAAVSALEITKKSS